MKPIRVLITDDHPLYRDGMQVQFDLVLILFPKPPIGFRLELSLKALSTYSGVQKY